MEGRGAPDCDGDARLTLVVFLAGGWFVCACFPYTFVLVVLSARGVGRIEGRWESAGAGASQVHACIAVDTAEPTVLVWHLPGAAWRARGGRPRVAPAAAPAAAAGAPPTYNAPPPVPDFFAASSSLQLGSGLPRHGSTAWPATNTSPAAAWARRTHHPVAVGSLAASPTFL